MQYYSRFRAVSVFDVRPFSYYLVRPGQLTMQYCSSEWSLSLMRLVGPDQQPTQYCSSVEGLSALMRPGQQSIQASVGHLSLMRPGSSIP